MYSKMEEEKARRETKRKCPKCGKIFTKRFNRDRHVLICYVPKDCSNLSLSPASKKIKKTKQCNVCFTGDMH